MDSSRRPSGTTTLSFGERMGLDRAPHPTLEQVIPPGTGSTIRSAGMGLNPAFRSGCLGTGARTKVA